jgi:hypothetical protein
MTGQGGAVQRLIELGFSQYEAQAYVGLLGREPRPTSTGGGTSSRCLTPPNWTPVKSPARPQGGGTGRSGRRIGGRR